MLASPLLSNMLKMIYKTNFPLVTYGCETWSRALSGKHKLQVFKNKGSSEKCLDLRGMKHEQFSIWHNEEL
jgi:hypothetical protein